MFDSGVTAAQLSERLQNEIDIAYPIPSQAFAAWINAVEQLLYTEIIQEQGSIMTTGPFEDGIILQNLVHSVERDGVRFSDILMVYADGKELKKTTLNNQRFFTNVYYFNKDRLFVNTVPQANEIEIIYLIRPKLKTESSLLTDRIMVPPEFLELVMSKIRAEAYKSVNEDAVAAKWMNDYNILLENFKVWMMQKKPNFGI